MNYREKAIRLGNETPLMAIVTEPPAGVAPSGKGVVLLNAGLLHRVGPSRLNVQIARKLAPLGHVSVRFDFSGIGDSEARRDGLPFERSSVLEVQDAMAALAARGVRDYTLVGLCSGADAAFLTALADTRVTGLIMMDPWIYRTARYHVFRYLSKARDAKSWRKLLSGDLLIRRVLRPAFAKMFMSPESSDNVNVVVAHYARDFPPREKVQKQVGFLVGRGVRMLSIFSGGMPEHVSYQGQYRDCFREIDFGDLLSEHFDGHAEHIFSALRHQRWVGDLVTAWLSENVSEDVAGAATLQTV